MSWEHYDLIKSEDKKYLLRLANCSYDLKIQFEIVDTKTEEIISMVEFKEYESNGEVYSDVSIPVLRDNYEINEDLEDDEEPEIDEDQFFKVYRNNNKCLEFSHDGLDVSGVLITFNQFKISDKDEKRLPIRIAAGLNAMFDY